MNSDTAKAFLAGALLPSIAFYFWNARTNRRLRDFQKAAYEEDDDDDDDDDDRYDDELLDNIADATASGGTTTTATTPILSAAEWGMAHAPYKMLLVVNTELTGMGKGKMAAQCCHAAVGCHQRAIKHCPAAVRAWERTGCAKIAVKCPSTGELVRIAATARSHGIPYYLVEDAGRTQIAAGSRTVVGLFGPVSVFEGFTDHFKLM